MKPYYEDTAAGITIYNADCRAVVPSVACDILITDPPYGLEGLAVSYGRHGATIENDADATMRDAVLALWGPLKPVCVFATPRLPEPPGHWDHRLVWDKVEAGMNGGPWRYSHELIFVRGDGWVRLSDNAFSVFRVPIRNGAPDRATHPHRKPVALMGCLVAAAPEGVILDPFMGSGTTLRAAKDLGRRAIGIEIEEKYAEIAAQRLSQEVLAL